MKIYTFAVHNWKADYGKAFWLKKRFPSAYAADRWATRITFKAKNSPYMVSLIPGSEQ